MIYLNIPVGGAHGWGICGKSIAREMVKLAGVRLLTDAFTPQSIGDEIEFAALQRLLPSPDEAKKLAAGVGAGRLDGPLLQLANKQLQPMHPAVRGSYTLGYTFFEDTQLLPQYLENAKHFDRIAAGSNWCADILRRHGLNDVATVLQGVEPQIFFPHEPPRRFFGDQFVVFSGGKFEFRKGHDLVIRAFKALSERHRDVLLVTAWSNPWDFSFNSMRQSPHIRFRPAAAAELAQAPARVLAENGVDLRRVVMLGAAPQQRMADAYRNSDVGVFPNRAEGGTNLVLMEYMACGKPVIATDSTGHADVVNADNAIVIGTRGEVQTSSDGMASAIWPEPVLDEVIEKLEWAYQNRVALKPLGEHGAEMIAKLTWEQTAKQMMALLRGTGSIPQ